MSAIQPSELRAFGKRLRSDPVAFCRDGLGWLPWPKQEEMLCSLRDNPRTAVQACHGSGKTATAGRAVLWFLAAHVPSIAFTTAPTWRQTKELLWREIGTAYRGARIPYGGELFRVPRLEIAPDHFAFGFSTDKPDSFQGIHAAAVLGIFDEASGIAGDLWMALEGTLAAGFPRFLATGNPLDPGSSFCTECRDGGTNTIVISAYDTPNFTAFGITERDIAGGAWRDKVSMRLPIPSLVTPQFAADMYRKYGPESPAYISRVLGQFPETATDALIPYAAIIAARDRWLDYRQDPQSAQIVPEGAVELGVDVARFGDDLTVLCRRQGGHVHELEAIACCDTMATAGRVADSVRQYRGSAKVDAIGIGAGVVDRLREQNLDTVVGINVAERARDAERFANVRAEGYWHLREQFIEGQIAIPPDEDLIHELTSLKYSHTSSGQIKIEAKEEMKRRLRRSPDRADALMLCFYDRIPDYSVTYTLAPEYDLSESEIRSQQTILELLRLHEQGHGPCW